MKSDYESYSKRESLVIELCDEIDFWKDQAKYYKNLYDEERKTSTKHVQDSIDHNIGMIGQMLSLSLRIRETDKGLLIAKQYEEV